MPSFTPRALLSLLFNGSKAIEIDRDWLRRLDQSASSSTGLIVTNAAGELIKAGAFRLHR